MFFSIVSATVPPKSAEGGMRPIHLGAFATDLITGIALVVIGILASQSGATSFSLISTSSGTAYLAAIVSLTAFLIKQQIAPDWFLFTH